jgi:hypothetical protein
VGGGRFGDPTAPITGNRPGRHRASTRNCCAASRRAHRLNYRDGGLRLVLEVQSSSSAAASLREGLDETLTVLRLGVAPTLVRTLRQDELHREHDRNMSGSLLQRQTLARRADGTALVRGRDGRSRQTVPSGQRPPTPSEATSRSRTACRSRKCHNQRPQSHRDTVCQHMPVSERPRSSGDRASVP